MSTTMVQAVMASSIKPAGVRLVALCLAWHCNDDTGEAWPSLATLASEAGVTRARVKQAIKQLLAGSVLEVAAKGAGGNPRATTRYVFSIAWAGKHATRVAGLPGKQNASDPVSPGSKGGKPTYPNRNERKPSASLSLKQRRSRAPAAPRGRTVAPAAPGEIFRGVVDYGEEA